MLKNHLVCPAFSSPYTGHHIPKGLRLCFLLLLLSSLYASASSLCSLRLDVVVVVVVDVDVDVVVVVVAVVAAALS